MKSLKNITKPALIFFVVIEAIIIIGFIVTLFKHI